MTGRIRFSGGETDSLYEEFIEREKYRNYATFPGAVDVIYDKISYGLINSEYEPVYLVPSSLILQNFAPYAQNVEAIKFVSDAFSDFRSAYLNKVSSSNRVTPRFLGEIIPVLGYSSLEEIYSKYMVFLNTKYSTILESNKSVNDFNCYLTAIKLLLKKNLHKFPITRSGFILSNKNTPRTSGLVVELTKLDYNQDFSKGEIIQSDDFYCYAQFAKNFGFYIDKYSPWRLYANLQHETMRERIKRGREGFDSAEQVVDSVFRLRSHRDDIYDLQDFILKVYNEIKNTTPYYTETRYNPRLNTTERKLVIRPDEKVFSTEQWLELLLEVRMLELQVYNSNEFTFHKDSVIMTNKLYGLQAATDRIGVICSNYIRVKYERKKYSNPTP